MNRVFCWSVFLWVMVLGCGCKPFISQEEQSRLAQVSLGNIPEMSGIKLSQLLEKWMASHTGAPSRYILSVRLTESQVPLAIADNALTINYRYIVKATYSLYEKKTRKSIFVRERSAFGSYNVVRNVFYADTVAQESARDNCIQTLALGILTDVIRALPRDIP